MLGICRDNGREKLLILENAVRLNIARCLILALFVFRQMVFCLDSEKLLDFWRNVVLLRLVFLKIIKNVQISEIGQDEKDQNIKKSAQIKAVRKETVSNIY